MKTAGLQAVVLVMSLLPQAVLIAQTDSRQKLFITVIQDDKPCRWASVTIRPIGSVEGWPAGKTQIELTTDEKGHAATTLGSGTYRVTAQDSVKNKEPTAARVVIGHTSGKPARVWLELRYWNCGVVKCEL